jgi:DNA repair exonuclease SbcCD ATPase subunit
MSGETARTDADELARITQERDVLEARLVDADAVLVRAGLVGSASDVAAALARIEAARVDLEGQRQNAEAYQRQCKRLRERVEAAERELADEQAFHAKTADNFVEAGAGWSEERERLTRERNAAVQRGDGYKAQANAQFERAEAAERLAAEAVQRAEADGRTCVKMGTRNREMMGERDEARRELHERQRECALSRARDGLQRFGADKAIEARAREIAEAAGWSCYSAEGEQP